MFVPQIFDTLWENIQFEVCISGFVCVVIFMN